MNSNNDFEQLIQRYMDGQAKSAEVEQLNEQLAGDHEARKKFCEQLNLDSALAAIAAGDVPENLSPAELKPAFQEQGRRSSAIWILSLVASFFLLISIASWWKPVARPLATVTSAAGIEEISRGSLLFKQRVKINKGFLEIVSVTGAKIAIEAPAEFWFESAQRLHMKYGRMAADIPDTAKGFTVVTPEGEAVDLGTKFGVDVPSQGDAEIHVFQGEVIAQSSDGGKRKSLKDGEAFLLQSGAGSSREFRSSAFIRPGEVASLHAALEVGQQERSEAAKENLKNDPALITLLDFESEETLPMGTYRMGQGRWPGSRAPEFVNVGDHMKIDVGGKREWSELTLAAWVRLDQLGEPYQSLLHTDGWGEQDGQVHWMVTQESTMRLALYGNKLAPHSTSQHGFPDSLQPVLPEQGRWVHLAVVYHSAQRTVRFYFNGEFDNKEKQQLAHPARLGPAQIGNWNLHDRKLSGRMDELLILGRIMNDDEIHNLFEAGTPYR